LHILEVVIILPIIVFNQMRKRNILFTFLFLGIICLLPACSIFEECGLCEMVTVKADGSDSRSAPIALCSDDLDEKQNFIPQEVDGNTIYWECN
jgi:hypothetical protein